MVDELLQKKPDMRPDLHQIFEMQAMKDKMALLGYEDAADLVGGEVEELRYDGDKKPKKLKLSWLKEAFRIKKLNLPFNEIVTIEKLNHLKELKKLNLSCNKI